MNRKYENNFISKFIVKNRRDRIAYELSNAKKRQNAMDRFCHNTLDYIDQTKIIYEGNSIGREELKNIMNQYENEKQCYIIAWDSEVDGTFLDREEAIDVAFENGMATILVFNNLIVITEEQEQGPAMKYILFSDRE